MRTALEYKLLGIKPYEYSTIVKLQKERLPYISSLSLAEVDSIHYRDTIITRGSLQRIFYTENFPVTEKMSGDFSFRKNLLECIEDLITLPFVMYCSYNSTEDYLAFLQRFEVVYNTMYIYLIYTAPSQEDEFYLATASNKEIPLLVYPVGFANRSYFTSLSGVRNLIKTGYYTKTFTASMTASSVNVEIDVTDEEFMKNPFAISTTPSNFFVFVDDGSMNIVNRDMYTVTRESYSSFLVDISKLTAGNYRSHATVNILFFYFIMTDEYQSVYDKIYRLSDGVSMNLLNSSAGAYTSAEIEKLNSSLNFSEIDRQSPVRFYEYLKKVMNYDISLVDEFLSKSNYRFESLTVTGAKLMGMYSDITGRITIPIRNLENTEGTVVLLFKNGYLYDKYDTMLYYFDKVTFVYTEGYNTDLYEIVYIHGVQFYPDKEITAGENVSLPLGKDEYEFFMKTPTNEYFQLKEIAPTYQIKKDVALSNGASPEVYTIDYTNSNIQPGDELIVTHKNRFRYVAYDILSECINISLPASFKFCQNKDQFMIFLNGQKLLYDQFTVVKPLTTLPFYELAIFSKVVFSEGDRLDIFYMPYIPQTSLSDVTDSYDIEWNSSLVNRAFTKDNTLIFTNGFKLYRSSIENLTNTKIHITSDFPSKKNVEAYFDPRLSEDAAIELEEININANDTTVSSAINSVRIKTPGVLAHGDLISSTITRESFIKEKIEGNMNGTTNSASSIQLINQDNSYIATLRCKDNSLYFHLRDSELLDLAVQSIFNNDDGGTIDNYTLLKTANPAKVYVVVGSVDGAGVYNLMLISVTINYTAAIIECDSLHTINSYHWISTLSEGNFIAECINDAYLLIALNIDNLLHVYAVDSSDGSISFVDIYPEMIDKIVGVTVTNMISTVRCKDINGRLISINYNSNFK